METMQDLPPSFPHDLFFLENTCDVTKGANFSSGSATITSGSPVLAEGHKQRAKLTAFWKVFDYLTLKTSTHSGHRRAGKKEKETVGITWNL